MSYLLQTKKHKSGLKPVLIVVFVIIVLGGILFSPFSSAFKYIASYTGADKLRDNVSRWFKIKSLLVVENRTLENKINELKAQVADRDVLLYQNEELKGLNVSDTSQKKIATVLLHPGFSPYDSFVISLGSKDDVLLGDLVSFHSLVIGEVSEVNTNTSRVTLFSTSGKTFPVRIGKLGIESEAKGLGGGSFEILLPKNVVVEIGETVYLASNLPRVFGKVMDIESVENDAFQRVLFSLPININKVEFVTLDKRDL